MTESLSPTILASISNLFNYTNLQTVLLDIVKTVESLSRDVTAVKATILQLSEDKVSKSEFNVFVGAMGGLQTKIDGMDAKLSRAHDDASSFSSSRRDFESQLDKMKQQIAELEAKMNKARVASFSNNNTAAPVDPEEIRKLHLLLSQKVDVDTFRDFREQMLKGEQNHSSLKKSIQDALDALNAKAAATEKYENEMRQRQQHFFDTLKEYNDKLLHLESLKELLNSKVDMSDYEIRMKVLESKINQELGDKETQIRDLYNGLKKKADITQLIELEQIVGTVFHTEDGGTAAGRSQLKCLSCDKPYNTLSGATIDVTTLTNSQNLRKSTGSPNTGRKMMVLGTDGMVYQGRDLASSITENEYENSPPVTSRPTRPPSPSLTSSRKPRPQSARRF